MIRGHEPVAWDEPGVEDVVWLWLDAFPVVVINWSLSIGRHQLVVINGAAGGDLYDEVIGPGGEGE